MRNRVRTAPSVSIVVNTLDRAESLRRTLLSLRQLTYPEIEIVVVVGPSKDHTDRVVGELAGQIKVGRCQERNLSASRNLGVKLAAGELVAFIDDDSVPDPWWLDDVVPAFQHDEVAAAGGPVYDFDGTTLFSRYSLVTRHGDASTWTDGPNPSLVLAAPMTDLVVYPIGTNSIFRRSALTEIGGFDEEFSYFLEESDACRRLVDRGWVVQACDRGFVYHFRGPSAIRTGERVTRDLHQVLKSRLYFALRHAYPRVGVRDVIARYDAAVDLFRGGQRWGVENGLLRHDDLVQFEEDAVTAMDHAFEGLARGPKVRDPVWFDQSEPDLLPLARQTPDRRLHVCIVTQEYLPRQLNGIARLSHELARGLMERGHVVRILTEADGGDTVDHEDGVWVHRLAPRPGSAPDGLEVPPGIWNFSAAVLAELQRIEDFRPVDVVEVPNWNSEGIAVVEDDGFTTVLGLHTPLATVARLDPRIDAGDPEIAKLLALERRCYEGANGFLACGAASVRQIEEEYGLEFPRERIGFVPFGISDRRQPRQQVVADRINVLFVGRLEARKGIDTLLEAIVLLLPKLPEAAFTIVGNDTIPSESGRTYREEFERSTDPRLRDGRVLFRGVAPNEELDRHYALCDIFVAPSRSESFGLILLEAMREGKPVIAGDVGGMSEVVEHEGNGLLVPPGDAPALAEALGRLVTSPSLRDTYGKRSRALFLERFTAARMAEDYERFCVGLLEREASDAVTAGGVRG